MYEKILVPVDGSTVALKGLAEALELAKVLRARIKLVHVMNEPILADPTMSPPVYLPQDIENMRARGNEVLARAQAMTNEHETSVESELIETIGARASDHIIAAAKQWPADLIVMGTHGRRGLKRLALGSDAESVLRATPVPVLMVRETEG